MGDNFFYFIYFSCEFRLAERIRTMGCDWHGMIVRQSGEILCKVGGIFRPSFQRLAIGGKKGRSWHYDHRYERVSVKLPKLSRSEFS
jgi:hypothetical protein